mmetsp:Transcript_10767/g.28614  ORF Transcript_10767/g.28614 Transcript_10767/m.28614 type:complete len:383 (-) Transcript_10767:140-1288(-)
MGDEFEQGSSWPWAIFWLAFLGLAAFDLLCLAPRSKGGAQSASPNSDSTESGRLAILHVLFWFCIGLVFNLGILLTLGSDAAIVWFDGYILEYLLSMDNLFFFHVVFTTYATPPSQVYKALFLGIVGAVVLRLFFYVFGGDIFRAAFAAQVFFALVLIYSGYKTAFSDDDDDDPRQNRCVLFVTRCLPLTDSYDDDGALFMRVAVRDDRKKTTGHSVEPSVFGRVDTELDAESPASSAGANGAAGVKTVWRGTLLLLVVVVLQVVDVLFAVDSVTAKIAEHDSTFINFSSSAFAMLCLRSMYFVLTRLLRYFRFMKYGVAAILVLIGVKLIINPWFHMGEFYSLVIICSAFAVSVVVSVMFPEPESPGEVQNIELESLQEQS